LDRSTAYRALLAELSDERLDNDRVLLYGRGVLLERNETYQTSVSAASMAWLRLQN
jgi:hypothetical protein